MKNLTKLAVEKAKEVVFTLKDITTKNLLKMRKENPVKFDKVVLGVEEEKTS